jgi:hypothetical protein
MYSITVTILLYFIIKPSQNELISFIIIVVFCHLLYTLPYILIHRHYIKQNKNVEFFVLNDFYEYKKGQYIVRFGIPDIVRIDYHWRREVLRDTFTIVPWGDFHFARIILTDGREVIITHFLKPEFIIKDFDNAWMHKRFYPHTKWHWELHDPEKFNEKELKAERNEYKFFHDEEDD